MNPKEEAFKKYLEVTKGFGIGSPDGRSISQEERKRELFNETCGKYIDIAIKERDKEIREAIKKYFVHGYVEAGEHSPNCRMCKVLKELGLDKAKDYLGIAYRNKWKKRPIEVEAEQWFNVTYDKEAGIKGVDNNDEPIYHLGVGFYRTPELDGKNKCKHCGEIMHKHGWIDTLEDGHIVCPSDWIIKGIKGEFYPCKNNIFKLTYEAVTEEGDNCR